MAELRVLLQSNGAFKSELLKSFLSASRGGTTAGPLSTTSGPNMNTASPITALPPADVNRNMDPSQFVTGNINSNIMSQNLNRNTVFPSTQTTPINVNETSAHLMPSLDNSDSTTTTGTILSSSPKNGATPNLNLNSGANINAVTKKMDNLNMNTASTTTQETDTSQTTINPFADVESNEDFVAHVMNEVKQTPTETRNLLTAQVTDAIVAAHLETTINTYANVAEANERVKNQKAPPEMPDMAKMMANPSMMWQMFMKSMAPEITKVVMFTKKLPGFSEIQQQDQMLLIKQGCFEVMIARFCMLIDHINEEMFDPALKMKQSRHMVKELPMGVFMDQFFDIAKLFNPLELTDGEIGLFTAILMFCADRPGLTDKGSIAIIQQLYMQSLYDQMKESHKDADNAFSTLISLIPIFHKINEDHIKFINVMKSKAASEGGVQFPPLHSEMFGEESTEKST